MSRHGSLVWVLPSAARRLLVVLMAAVLIVPSLAAARKASGKPGKTQGKTSARKTTVARAADPAPAKRTASATRTTSRSAKARAVSTAKASIRARRHRRVVSAEPTRPGSRGWVDQHVHVRKGETLDHILAMNGFGPGSASPWLHAADDVYDLRGIRPGHGFTLRWDRASRELESIRYEVDDDSLLVVQRDLETDELSAHVEALPYFRETRGIVGRIERGLREDALALGVPPSVASSLAEIFGWDLDVEKDLEPGDEFRVIYENIWEVGRDEPLTGQVLGAQITSRGHRYDAVLFEDDQGGAYYRSNGESRAREFLRYPVEFTEISSEFSASRFHPILHRDRPHLGVDFAAPQGTPVRAAADGYITEAGRTTGGLGIAVRVTHAGDVTTTYGHLCQIAPGVHEGGTVEKGQVIGWVGATGLATGAHLHYEIEYAGEHVDPMTVSAPVVMAVAQPLRRQFDRVKSTVVQQLAALPETDRPVSVALTSASTRATRLE